MNLNVPSMPTKGFLQKHGKAAARLLGEIKGNHADTRAKWSQVGEHAAAVRDSAPRGSGLVRMWADEYFGISSAPVLASRCIWLFEHPDAVAMVAEDITSPDPIYKAWGKIVDKRLDAFVAEGRNDLDIVAAELGATAGELTRRLDKARQRAEKRRQKDEDDALEQAVANEEVVPHNAILPQADAFEPETFIKNCCSFEAEIKKVLDASEHIEALGRHEVGCRDSLDDLIALKDAISELIDDVQNEVFGQEQAAEAEEDEQRLKDILVWNDKATWVAANDEGYTMKRIALALNRSTSTVSIAIGKLRAEQGE